MSYEPQKERNIIMKRIKCFRSFLGGAGRVQPLYLICSGKEKIPNKIAEISVRKDSSEPEAKMEDGQMKLREIKGEVTE